MEPSIWWLVFGITGLALIGSMMLFVHACDAI